MERKYKVYKITSPDGMVYIGYSGEKRIKDRWRKHIHQHTTLEPYIKKYGFENLVKEVVKDELTKQEAIELEGILIDEYKEKGFCINKMGSGGEDMLKKRCNECSRRYREEHKDYFKDYKKHYREEHKEDEKLKNKIYYEKNKNNILERMMIYREEHKEEIKERRHQYREKHKERIKEYNRRYREKKKREKMEK